MSKNIEYEVIRKAVRSYDQDSVYVEYIREVMKKWKDLPVRERLLVSGIYEHHTKKRCFTSNQRSAIVAMYLKHKAG